MITFAILILIVAKALPGLNTHISSIHVTRITSIVFLFAGALSLNSLNLESIGSGIGIYSGLFQVTSISQLIEIFLFMIGGGILIAWPQIKYNLYLPAFPATPSAFPPKDPTAFPPKDPTATPTPTEGEAGKNAQHRYLGSAATSDAPAAKQGNTLLEEDSPKSGTLPTSYAGVALAAAQEGVGSSPLHPSQLLLRYVGGSNSCGSNSKAVPAYSYCFSVGGRGAEGAFGTAQLQLSPEGGAAVAADAAAAAAAQSNLEKFTLFLTDKHSTDYSLVVLFSSLGSSLLISSYDLISVYLSIELQSFGLYVLSTLYRDSESSTSAGLKYFLLGGLSSCIILLGTGIIYSYTGTTNLESLYIINSVIDVNQQYIITDATLRSAGSISLGLSLIFIGFLFKIAAAPLHNWSPDVYDGTPTIVTTWLTIIPKIAILFILLELQVKLGSFGLLGSNYLLATLPSAQMDPSFNSSQSQLLWGGGAFGFAGLKTTIINSSGFLLKTLLLISATLSLIIGSLLGLAQIKIKRLLAYSTISHIGFILLALAVNTEQSIDSFIFYIIQYTITNLNIFLVILGLTYCLSTNSSPHTSLSDTSDSLLSIKAVAEAKQSPLFLLFGASSRANAKQAGQYSPKEGFCESCGEDKNKDISFISEFKGLFFSNPLLSLSLAVSLFSMAGIPPLIGFFSKQLVLYSALQNGYYFISVLAIIVSVISCSYYLQIIKVLLTKSSSFGPTLTSPPSPLDSLPHCSEGLWQFLVAKQREVYSQARAKNEIILTNTHSYLISTLTFTILLFFIKPSLILNSTQLLSLSLFYI